MSRPTHVSQKVASFVLIVFLVISLCKETVVLQLMVSNIDRSILSIADIAPISVKVTNQLPVEEDDDVISGTFNNLDVVYRGPNRTLHSATECIGESFSSDSWMYRSCMYRNLCFNVKSNEFVLFQSPTNKQMQDTVNQGSHFLSSSLNATVSLGGFVSSWRGGKSRLEWSPTIGDPMDLVSTGYYELIGDAVMIPFHSMGANNIGHFIWDSLLPIYTLVSIFGLENNKLLLLRYVLEGKPLPFSCEEKFKEKCENNFKKLLPLMGVPSSEFSTNLDPVLNLTHEAKSPYVCSSYGAAGIGMLTDHGDRSHGKLVSDYIGMHNYGRGPLLFDFRNFILKNMGMKLPSRLSAATPIRITFSIHSSGRDHRNLDFATQIASLVAFSDPRIVVESFQFSELSMEEEIEIVARSSILVTACGGGAVSSMFLPRGAGLIMFYAEKRERVANAKLDFDYLNNMGYVRTHWLPTKNMNHETSLVSFITLIRNEIDIITLG